MRNSILLFILTTLATVAYSQTIIKHVSSKSNTSGHITTINNSATNNKPNAVLIVTQNFGVYNVHEIGVWYSGGKWKIFNQNKKAMPLNNQFNIMVLPKSKRSFVHTTNKSNTNGHITTLDYTSTNKISNALLFVTQNFGKYNTSVVGVWYNGGKWKIYNEDRKPMPVGTKFNVYVVNESKVNSKLQKGIAFKHSNQSTGHISWMDQLASKKYNTMQLFITQNFNGQYNPHATGVWYSKGKWSAYNQDKKTMKKGVQFNVLAVKSLGNTKSVTNEQTMPELSKKYKALELQISPELKTTLLKLRTKGIEKKWTFQVGNTSVAKYINRDIKLITGILPFPPSEMPRSPNPSTPLPKALNLKISPTASSLDLRNIGLISAVRDQNPCGSCWAFGAIACIETAHIIRNKVDPYQINLSEQYVLSCSGAGTCRGGWPRKVFQHFVSIDKGCPEDNTFRYTASAVSCPAISEYSDYKVKTWGWVGRNKELANVQEVKTALSKYGAVESWIHVNSSFVYYTNGVINDNNRQGPGDLHCVQIVGWDDSKQAYLIKNSWGTGWGMDGFAWVRYDVLDIGMNAAWVIAKETETIDLNSYYNCNDGGHYYLRQIGNDVYWFGEHPSGNWANVFKGKLNGNKLTGYFHDVPKGRMNGRDELRLEVSNGGKNIRKISGAFGGSSFTKAQRPGRLPGSRSAGYSQAGNIRDMDGLWSCNDGGKYYIREKSGKIIWFGEGGLNSNGIPAFANVAVGTRSGNYIYVDWADVPKCNLVGKGKLTLRINNADEIVKTNGSRFGGSKWKRSASKNISGTWKNTDANTRGITKFVVTNNGTTIQVYGSCSPIDCDWGKTTLKKSDSTYKAFYDHGFGTKSLKLYPQSNGQIKISAISKYRDNRSDNTYTYYFKKL